MTLGVSIRTPKIHLTYFVCSRDLESGRRVKPPYLPSPSTCWPNQAVLSNKCSRLTLLLDRAKLPHGITVDELCNDLRRLLANYEAANHFQNELVLLCDLKMDYNDTIEVTLVNISIMFCSISISHETFLRFSLVKTAS